MHLSAEFLHLTPQDAKCAYVLVLKLFHLRGVPKHLAVGARLRLRMGAMEMLSRPCRAIEPGNVHGFGKRSEPSNRHIYLILYKNLIYQLLHESRNY